MNQSPSTRDASRRMSEPMNIRVCINKYNNNVNKDFVVVSQSSKTKTENLEGLPNNNSNEGKQKSKRMNDSFQVYSIQPSQKVDSILKTEIPPIDSIDSNETLPPVSDTIDTSSSSCVFVEDNCHTLFKSDTSVAEPKSTYKPLLLLIPLRLGQDKFNTEYAKPLFSCLKLPQSVGIIGGRPKHALYIYGYQDERVFYLDPHTTQTSVTVPHDSLRIPDNSFHTSTVESMHFSELDPSLALGFFCESEAVFDDLLDQLECQVLSQKPKLFEISENVPFLFERAKSHTISTKQEPFSLVGKSDLMDDVIDLALDEDIDEWDVITYDQID